MITAIQTVRFNGTVFNPGDEIVGLSPSQVAELLEAVAIIETPDPTPEPPEPRKRRKPTDGSNSDG